MCIIHRALGMNGGLLRTQRKRTGKVLKRSSGRTKVTGWWMLVPSSLVLFLLIFSYLARLSASLFMCNFCFCPIPPSTGFVCLYGRLCSGAGRLPSLHSTYVHTCIHTYVFNLRGAFVVVLCITPIHTRDFVPILGLSIGVPDISK